MGKLVCGDGLSSEEGYLVPKHYGVEVSTRTETAPRFTDFDFGFRCVMNTKSINV